MGFEVIQNKQAVFLINLPGLCDQTSLNQTSMPSSFIHPYFFKDFVHLFLERGREEEREREKYQCVVASHMVPTEDLAATQACALTRNQTGDSGLQPSLDPLSYTSQGIIHPFSCTCTVTPLGPFNLRNFFLLKLVIGSGFVPPAQQARTTVKCVFSGPLALTTTVFAPLTPTVLLDGTSSGTSSLVVIWESSEL